jgi:hypothetical protein
VAGMLRVARVGGCLRRLTTTTRSLHEAVVSASDRKIEAKRRSDEIKEQRAIEIKAILRDELFIDASEFEQMVDKHDWFTAHDPKTICDKIEHLRSLRLSDEAIRNALLKSPKLLTFGLDAVGPNVMSFSVDSLF